ncbi:MAG: ABC transporter ATP-binding protein [Actinomycetota bacterium]|nr:ABC transporter ATP-binding protein [Actinomycetota bacterium]
MTTTVLDVRNLTKRFGDVIAVDDVSFEIGGGEMVGLVGQNGAGKSTTIHMVLGLTTPSSGSITILGRDPHHDRSALQQVNFSAAYTSLPQTLSVEENLIVFARLYGLRKPRRRVHEVLELLGVPHFAPMRTRSLSSGQATLVHIAKALLNKPRLLLLDEPTASLDPDAADRTRGVLRRVSIDEGFTTLITSHNMREVEEMCHRIIFIHRGRVVATGSPAEVTAAYGSPDLESAFLRVTRGEP